MLGFHFPCLVKIIIGESLEEWDALSRSEVLFVENWDQNRGKK